MNKTLLYSFTHNKKRNVSSEISALIEEVDHYYVDSTTNESGWNSINGLLELIQTNKYKYIVGLGVHSTSNKTKIEKIAKNKFRNDTLILDAPEYYDIGEFITFDDGMNEIVNSNKMGNSWCNMSAFLIRRKVLEKNLMALNGFIHILDSPEKLQSYTDLVKKVLNNITNFPLTV